MPLDIYYQNTTNIINIPFPPSISVDEIVQIHINNDIKNVNQTMNAFMIYRKEYNHVVAKFNLLSKDVSKFVSISWKNEPEDVKDYYRQMAKEVKKCFKEKVPSLCFINSNITNDNQDTSNPSLDMDQNFPPPLNIKHPLVSRNDLLEYVTMDEEKFMDHLSEEMALTYKAISQSLK
ncbi:11971_t:CDS:1 [Diversispora eburnea]|uniref:11971_t:CDS:1 n=1 Tax=Diversispora eburnea TaxID=1213867 RepID=A0A9N9C811_9GLOM|nr:11971_t:CDS:1 [Diversispora eburnea]